MTTTATMRPDVRSEVVTGLKRLYSMVEEKGWLRKGKCPQCGGKELFTHAASPWVVKCGRENKCGWSSSTKDLFPDAFGRFNERFPPTTQDPNATAIAYLDFVRGFAPAKIKGWFRQGHFRHPKGDRETATVVFDIDRGAGIFMERLIEPVRVRRPDGEIEIRKANFEGQHKGLWWAPPGLKIADELWIVEACIDAIALTLAGVPAVASLSAVNFPEVEIKKLDPMKTTLVWALDNDRAGNGYTHKHAKAAKALGFQSRAAVIPQKGKAKVDWNDCHLAGDLEETDIERYRFHGDLLMAATPAEKGCLIWRRTSSTSFAVEHHAQTYWWSLPQELFTKQLEEFKTTGHAASDRGYEFDAAMKVTRVDKIANCAFKFLYFQRDMQTDESWYYTRIDFPYGRHGGLKNTFTGPQISTSSEFKKRLLSIAPGALFQGNSFQLNWIISRYLDDIKIVDTVDFIGYSRQHRAYIFPDKAVSDGVIYDINDEDFFEIGQMSVKSLNTSLPLVIGKASDYDAKWVEHVHEAFGPKGIIAAAFFLGSLFAEQIRERHKSFPFLEIVGQAGAGKSTLIEFLWKLVGRNDYEGFDPNKSTTAARARIMSQVSNLPICMIESDRGDDTSKVRQFDWDELKTAYNGRASRATGVKNGGNDTKEPPFRGSIIISQNNPVDASEAIMSRIVHTFFDRSRHNERTKIAADELAAIPVEKVSNFLLQACRREADILALFHERALSYEAQLQKLPEVKLYRIGKCHGQLMALVDALAMLVNIKPDIRQETMTCLMEAAKERQRSISADHPLVEEFWDMVDFIGMDKLNHSANDQLIAINFPHLIREATRQNQQLPPISDLKKVLKGSLSRPFVESNRTVNSVIEKSSVKCWVFRAEKGTSHA
jgi:hypothetical protein